MSLISCHVGLYLLMHADRCEDGEVVRVHVGVREQARAREDALHVGLVRDVAGRLSIRAGARPGICASHDSWALRARFCVRSR